MKRALIICGGWEGHHPEETSKGIAETLTAESFKIELSNTLEPLGDLNRLTTFDLVIPNWTMGTLRPEQEEALRAAVQSGVGLGGFHGGMGDAFRSSITYQFITGGQFVAHPDDITEYTVNIVKKSDPIVAGLSNFRVLSEQYYMHVDPAVEILATTTFKTRSAPWINGTVMPVAWKRMYGAGRVFFCSIGHTTADFAIPEVIQMIRRGLCWAAR